MQLSVLAFRKFGVIKASYDNSTTRAQQVIALNNS